MQNDLVWPKNTNASEMIEDCTWHPSIFLKCNKHTLENFYCLAGWLWAVLGGSNDVPLLGVRLRNCLRAPVYYYLWKVAVKEGLSCTRTRGNILYTVTDHSHGLTVRPCLLLAMLVTQRPIRDPCARSGRFGSSIG